MAFDTGWLRVGAVIAPLRVEGPAEGDDMARGEWTRRDVIRGLATAALVAALPVAPRGAAADGSGPMAAPRDREARRRWALARMDEMGQERLRCHDRFRNAQQVRDCQEAFERRYRAYNEIYL